MKLIITVCFAVVLGVNIFASPSYSGTVQIPYQTKGQLKAKCSAAGGDFSSDSASHSCYGKKGAVLCSKKTCVGDCPACGTKAVAKSLPDILGQPKKRPRVLQEGGGGESKDVNPTVLGGSGPGAPPVGSGGLIE
jgi:hypothetical protein